MVRKNILSTKYEFFVPQLINLTIIKSNRHQLYNFSFAVKQQYSFLILQYSLAYYHLIPHNISTSQNCSLKFSQSTGNSTLLPCHSLRHSFMSSPSSSFQKSPHSPWIQQMYRPYMATQYTNQFQIYTVSISKSPMMVVCQFLKIIIIFNLLLYHYMFFTISFFTYFNVL